MQLTLINLKELNLFKSNNHFHETKIDFTLLEYYRRDCVFHYYKSTFFSLCSEFPVNTDNVSF